MEDSLVMFLDCPAYLDADGARRCGLPAAVQDRYAVASTGGPLESARIRCPRSHWFNGTIESLMWDKHLPQRLGRRGGGVVHAAATGARPEPGGAGPG